MNQISVEATIAEVEATETTVQTQDAIIELNSAQMMLVGGGQAIIIID